MGFGRGDEAAEPFGAGQTERSDDEDGEGDGRDQHPEADFPGGRGFFIPLVQPTEESDDDRRHENDEKRIEMLEALGLELVDGGITGVPPGGQGAEHEEGRPAGQTGCLSRAFPEQKDQASEGQENPQQADHVEPDVGQGPDVQLGVIPGEERHRQAALLERHPEEDDDEENKPQGHEPFLGLGGRELDDLGLKGFGLGLLFFGEIGVLVIFPERPEDEHGHDQAQASHPESEMVGFAQGVDVALGERPQRFQGGAGVLGPGDIKIGAGLGQRSFQKAVGQSGDAGVICQSGPLKDPIAYDFRGARGEHRPDIDPHVEDRESPVAQGVVFRIVVEASDQGLEIALEKPGSDGDDGHGRDDEGKPRVHPRGKRQQGVSEKHDDQAQADGPAVAEDLVREQPAEQREEIDADHEHAVDEAGRGRGHPVFGLHEQDENRDHRVKAEPLAHVGEKGHEQALGMPFKHE